MRSTRAGGAWSPAAAVTGRGTDAIAIASLEHAPDAVFCGNDHMALAALQVARYEFNRQPGKKCTDEGIGPIYPAGTEVKVTGYRRKSRSHAVGHLSVGTTQDGGHICEWTFSVRNVSDAGAYMVQVVDGPGESVPEGLMEASNWQVTLGVSFGS